MIRVTVQLEPDDPFVRVSLTGWACVLNMRRHISFDRTSIRSATAATRRELETEIDHRILGIGAHDGSERLGDRRVGSMLGRGVIGTQFWAADSGSADEELLVLELADHDFVRAVIKADNPRSVAEGLSSLTSRMLGRGRCDVRSWP